MVKLPLAVPKYQTIPTHTQALAVLYGQNEEYADMWITNNCTSVLFEHNPEAHNTNPYLFVLPVYAMQNCSLLEYCKIPGHITSSNMENMIKELLHNDYYIATSVDAYYLPCHKAVYKKEHFFHQLLVYGYENDTLQVADHFLGGGGYFYMDEIHIGDFIEGYASAHTTIRNQNSFPDINAVRYRTNIKNYRINKNSIKGNIFFHLNSTNTGTAPLFLDYIPLDSFEKFSDIQFHCGHNALLSMQDDINSTEDSTANFHNAIHGLLVHSKIIRQVVEVTDAKNLLNESEQYVVKCTMLENIQLKRSISKDKRTVDRNLLKEAIELDYTICSELYKLLCM